MWLHPLPAIVTSGKGSEWKALFGVWTVIRGVENYCAARVYLIQLFMINFYDHFSVRPLTFLPEFVPRYVVIWASVIF